MNTREGSTKTVSFMTPRAGVLVQSRGNRRYVKAGYKILDPRERHMHFIVMVQKDL